MGRHACHVEGLSTREAARRLGLRRNTVCKMLAHAVPPGYWRRQLPPRPKLEAFRPIIDQILAADRLPQSTPDRPGQHQGRFSLRDDGNQHLGTCAIVAAREALMPCGSLLCQTAESRLAGNRGGASAASGVN